MSMSTHVVGFRTADEKWEHMKAIWVACRKVGVPPPDAVLNFFHHEFPDKPGCEVSLGDALKSWEDKCGDKDGYEVDVTKLPHDVNTLRFYNSY